MATLLANLKVLLPPFGRSVLITVIIITIKCVAARGLKLLRQIYFPWDTIHNTLIAIIREQSDDDRHHKIVTVNN